MILCSDCELILKTERRIKFIKIFYLIFNLNLISMLILKLTPLSPLITLVDFLINSIILTGMIILLEVSTNHLEILKQIIEIKKKKVQK